MEGLAGLVRGRRSDGLAPIEKLAVFEELAPTFSTILSHRAIDWCRRNNAQKNRPNAAPSLEAIAEALDRPVELADPASIPDDDLGSLRFEEIYERCADALTALEWRLVYEVYVAAERTRGELIEDPAILAAMGTDGSGSTATRRRRLNDHLESALAKLARRLVE